MYEEKGALIIAVAVQSQDDAANIVDKTGAQFPILADGDHTVAEAYGATSLALGFSVPEDPGWSRSHGAVFIINSDGQIVWEYLPSMSTDRVSSETILENLP